MAVRREVWYRDYENLRSQVLALREQFTQRCKELEVDPAAVLSEFAREFVARAVHESNWQEGLQLDRGKTQRLADLAFDEIEDVIGPHLDINQILRFHQTSVSRLKSGGATIEEVGAYNLARAHHAIQWVGLAQGHRECAALAQCVRGIQSSVPNLRDKISAESFATIEKGFKIVDKLESDESRVAVPMTMPPQSLGAMMKELLKLDFESLLHPMRTSYIHFFHRLVMMGIIPPKFCGHFRKTSVHVGNYDLFFPPPSAVPQMMREFCRKFPWITSQGKDSDRILSAAKVSHNFVAIHPYEDGNGRISRVLMNLILWPNFPPVYLKADKKGRHRYGQALRRADRGDFKPLAALIAMSLKEIYDRLIRSIGAQPVDS